MDIVGRKQLEKFMPLWLRLVRNNLKNSVKEMYKALGGRGFDLLIKAKESFPVK